MLLDPIGKDHILAATKRLDLEGVPVGNQWAEYWMIVNNKEYQFKHLIRIAYEIATGIKIDETKFTSSPFTRGFIQKKFKYKIYFRIPDNVQFFSQEEIEFFHQMAGQQYRANHRKDVVAGKRIKTSIFGKTNSWARLLNLEGYQIEIDERWQISGHFKKYSWARIFTTEGKRHKVFFTLGVSSEWTALVYKIDCQRKAYAKDKSLTPPEVQAFDRIVNGTGAEWGQVTFDELPHYNWELLYNVTLNFIKHYEALYLEAIFAVENARSLHVSKNGFLEQVPVPKDGLDQLPDKKYSFRGVTIDYDALNRNANEIGSGGEQLVIRLEQQILREKGRNDLADKVKKAEDGEGYDILSYFINGSKKYIEVKTTSGTVLRQFYMSHTEWAFMEMHADNYYLYRVFNYDKVADTGKFFCLSGNLKNQVLIRNTQFEVFLKAGTPELRKITIF